MIETQFKSLCVFKLTYPNIKCSRIAFAFTASGYLGAFANLQKATTVFVMSVCRENSRFIKVVPVTKYFPNVSKMSYLLTYSVLRI